MNEYPSVDGQDFTPAEKATFLGSAMCIATGPKNSTTVTANIPFGDLHVKPDWNAEAGSSAEILNKPATIPPPSP